MPSAAALLVLRNRVQPEALEDYEVWHAGEHVPERLSMPGFLTAERYRRKDGEGLLFLTVYGLDSLAALATSEYRRLLAHPTPASARMRPLMFDVRRQPVQLVRPAEPPEGKAVILTEFGAGAGERMPASVAAEPGHRLGQVTAAEVHPAFGVPPEPAGGWLALTPVVPVQGVSAEQAFLPIGEVHRRR